MSDSSLTLSPIDSVPPVVPARKAKTFIQHAKLIGFLTLISRFFGLGREVVAGHYLGTALVGSAFTVAFVVPNLFRKLFGEGALSAAFIPLYSQTVKNDSTQQANDFAAAAVNLLCAMLVGLTVVGEAIIWGILIFSGDFRPDRVLTLKLTAIMLPYVLLICGGAFLSAILQVHHRFGPPAAAPIILNACHIIVLLTGARILSLNPHLSSDANVAKQTMLAYWLAFFVLVAGIMQVGVLLPSLRKTGFRFKFVPHFWTPAIKKMMVLSLPVAMGAGVLQLSVFLDKGIAMALMQGPDRSGRLVTRFEAFGHSVRFPMEEGAPRRLDLAQYLYQFPLGIFAIALATAIFPGLSADALDKDRKKFRDVLRHGIEASLWEGLPASVGLILVAEPAVRLLFQHGEIDAHQAELIARSTIVYAGAIWAFSLLQIINRAYYAIHDTLTPVVMAVVNILINLIVEIPLLWWMGESGMAVGTVVSFAVQALVMLWMLDKKIGGLNLRQMAKPVVKMILATIVMGAVCLAIKRSPIYPVAPRRPVWAAQLCLLLIAGAGVYLAVCAALGVTVLRDLLPSRKSKT
jgi:putative peptidoglycan lipid II flippase